MEAKNREVSCEVSNQSYMCHKRPVVTTHVEFYVLLALVLLFFCDCLPSLAKVACTARLRALVPNPFIRETVARRNPVHFLREAKVRRHSHKMHESVVDETDQ